MLPRRASRGACSSRNASRTRVEESPRLVWFRANAEKNQVAKIKSEKGALDILNMAAKDIDKYFNPPPPKEKKAPAKKEAAKKE